MHAILEWASGATRANIVNDIVLVLTGTTDKASLSANLTQANSSITSSVAAGWTLHDASAGTNIQCVKAPIADDGAAYKYVCIDHSTTSELKLVGYDSWNASTHVGTGKYTGSDLAAHSQQSTPASYVIKMRIYASARCIIILAYRSGTRYGATNGGGPTGIFERSRTQPWDTVGNGYIPSVWSNLGSFVTSSTPTTCSSHATAKNYAGTNVQGYLNPCTIGVSANYFTTASEFPSSASAFFKNASGSDTIPMFPIWFTNPGTFVAPLGDISSISDVWTVPRGPMADFDEFTDNGKTYTVFGSSGTGCIAVRKG
ncbi:MAG: hypothetical protein HQL74_07285 [Magnetococcales bacterium]|nr:hypothetical protein [Magnetococcales bacterium]